MEKPLNILEIFDYLSYDANELISFVKDHPEYDNEKVNKVIEVYKNPLAFGELETKYFKDADFIHACKLVIKQKIKEERDFHSTYNKNYSSSHAEKILEFVEQKCYLEKLQLQRNAKKALPTDEEKINYVLSELSKRN